MPRLVHRLSTYSLHKACGQARVRYAVDVPLDEPKYDPKYSGPTVGCVVDKINEFRLIIEGQDASPSRIAVSPCGS